MAGQNLLFPCGRADANDRQDGLDAVRTASTHVVASSLRPGTHDSDKPPTDKVRRGTVVEGQGFRDDACGDEAME